MVNSVLMPWRAPELRKPFVVALVAELLAVIYVSTMNRHDHIDVEVYQLGARALLNGHQLYQDLPMTESGLPLPFIYPPFAAALFVPFALVPKTLAVITVMVLSHLALIASVYVVVRASERLVPYRQNILLVTAMVLPVATLTEPVIETLGYTQINLLLMVLVVVDCLWRIGGEKKLPWPRGLLVGIAAGIKISPAAFVLFFLLRRDFRAIVWSVVGLVATAILGGIASFSDSTQWWFDKVFRMDNVSFGQEFAGDSATFGGNQSVRSMLAQFQLSGFTLTAVFGICAVIVLALAILAMLHALREGNAPLALMINATAQLLLSPIAWTHHWVWAIPTLFLLTIMALGNRNWGLLMATGFATGLFIAEPMWWIPQGNGMELRWSFSQQLFGNTYVYLGLAFIVYCAYSWWHARRTGRGHGPDPGYERGRRLNRTSG